MLPKSHLLLLFSTKIYISRYEKHCARGKSAPPMNVSVWLSAAGSAAIAEAVPSTDWKQPRHKNVLWRIQ